MSQSPSPIVQPPVSPQPQKPARMGIEISLEPCPFCGSCKLTMQGESVMCDDCLGQGPCDLDGEGTAVAMWNTRTTTALREPDPVAVPVEQPALHDQYTMAALTGLLASGEYALEGALTEARTAADAAMEARKA